MKVLELAKGKEGYYNEDVDLLYGIQVFFKNNNTKIMYLNRL